MTPTHHAFSDDSGGAKQRYQSLSLFSLPDPLVIPLTGKLEALLKESNVTEFKWQELRSARYRFAAKKMIDLMFEHLHEVRIDTLVWDHEDKRHKVAGRDENENRVRMYYHLVSTTFSKRWPIANVHWSWRPDEQSAVDWDTLWDCLRTKKHKSIKDLFGENPDFEKVRLARPIPSESHLHPFIQVADLFAGIAAFSWEAFDRYELWLEQTVPTYQGNLFDAPPPQINFTSAERERFWLMKYLREKCGAYKLQVGLQSNRGFLSHKPQTAINFWNYRSSFQDDKAPLK